jgi:hypothetical protein
VFPPGLSIFKRHIGGGATANAVSNDTHVQHLPPSYVRVTCSPFPSRPAPYR